MTRGGRTCAWLRRVLVALLLAAGLGGGAAARGAEAPLVVLYPPPGTEVWDLNALGDRLVYLTRDLQGGWMRLWSVPAASPTSPELLHAAGDISRGQIVGGRLFFWSTGRTWETDGSVAGTRSLPEGVLHPRVACGPWLYFATVDGRLGRRVSEAGDVELLGPPGSWSFANEVGCVGDRLVLVSSDAEYHRWPDALVESLDAIQFEGRRGSAVFRNDVGYIAINPGPESGFQLFRTDGRVAGTTPLELPGGVAQNLVLLGERLFFARWTVPANYYDTTMDLYVTDGTPHDEHFLRSIPDSSYPFGYPQRSFRPPLEPLGLVGDVAILEWGSGVWRSDGTVDGTLLVAGYVAKVATNIGGQYISGVVTVGGLVYWALTNDVIGSKGGIFRTDGTLAGTTVVGEWDTSARLFIAAVNGSVFVMGPPAPPPPADPCAAAAAPIACELNALLEALSCDGGATSALRPRQSRGLRRLARRAAASNPTRALRAARRADAVIARLQRRLSSKRVHARLGDACADVLETRLEEARARLAARK